MNCKMPICIALILALFWCNPASSWAASGTVQLTGGNAFKGEIGFPPNDEIEMVLAASREDASLPIEDIEKIEVAAARPGVSDEIPLLKRLWRRLIGPSETQQTLTVTLRNGDVYRGWLSWRQSEGLVEIRPSKYVVQKAYLKSKQTDRERHHPVDVTRQYIRSITFSETETVARKECPKCGSSFEESDYKFCPLDGTALAESGASAQN